MPSHHNASLRSWFLSLPPVDWATQQLREILIGSLRCGPVPQHIAFVMDGNRRFARRSKLETVEGHHMGFESLARILEVCYKAGVRVVTIYAFSLENFKRPRYEVEAIMDMAKTRLMQMCQHGSLLEQFGASIRVLGDRSFLPPDVLAEVDRAEEMTKHNDRVVLNVCFPYTGREEITHAIRTTVRDYSLLPERPKAKRGFSEGHIQRNIRSRRLSGIDEEEQQQQQQQHASPSPSSIATSDAEITSGSEHDLDASSTLQPASSQTSTSASPVLRPSAPGHGRSQQSSPQGNLPDPETITPATLTRNTYTADAPPLDLLVRTSGVRRLSDFMIWQCHENTEIKFLDCLWPEFDLWSFLPVLIEWQRQQRKDNEGRRARGEGLKTA